jgi:hypothetical protein
MSERTFRIRIKNSSSYLTLQQKVAHLCHGQWTSSDWQPPATIAPGASGEAQSESCGFLTGTEAYLKYDLVAPDRIHGMIYIYWDNPFYGVTKYDYKRAVSDVPPDCDYEAPAGQSITVEDHSELDFNIGVASYDLGDAGGGTITNPGDLVHWAVPGSLIGLVGIYKHPTISFEIVDRRPTFSEHPPKLTLHLLSEATEEQWVGRWWSDQVTVEIKPTRSYPPLEATVEDPLQSPNSFTERFAPGAEKMPAAIKVELINFLAESHGLDRPHRKALTAAAEKLLQPSGAINRQVPVALQYHQLVRSFDLRPADSQRDSSTHNAANAVAHLAQFKGGAAYLSNRTALHLYGVFENGANVGFQLQLQRLGALGEPLTSVMLKPALDIR